MAATQLPASQVANDLTSADFAAAYVDGVAGNASLRTLGTGAQQAAAGNHTHSDYKKSYSATFGDGSATSFTITQATHGLASTAVLQAVVYRVSNGNAVNLNVSVNNSNGTVTITCDDPPASGAYRVVIFG